MLLWRCQSTASFSAWDSILTDGRAICVLCMGSILDLVTSDSVHLKFEFFFKHCSLHSLLQLMEDTLRVAGIHLLPNQQSFSAVRAAITIRICKTVLHVVF